MNVQQKVSKYMEAYRMPLPECGPVVVGFSGGADSVTLLHLLMKLGYKCIAAHCNFQLRNDESMRDEEFATSFAAGLNVESEVIRFDTQEFARRNHLSIEMAARELRYEWFNKLHQKHNAASVAVGHHADDAIETMLINLLRGTGIAGLSGIQPVNGMIIRPLLCIGKEDIMTYVQEFNLPFVTDASNFSTDIIRNKIRHELIPLAESINPSFRKTMVETMHHFRESTNLQHIYFQSVKESIVQQKDEEVRISIPAFQKSGGSVTLLHHFLKEYSFNPRLTNKIVRALDSEAGKLFYSPTHCLVKDRSELIIHPLNLKTNSNTAFEVTVFAKDDRFTLSTHPGIIHLDADQIRFPLQLRTWKAGDYFCPLGMKNKKKISDFLTDLKINRLEKKHIQVLTDGTDSRILWVVGYRIDDRYRVKSSTTTIAEIKLKKS